MGMRRYLSYIMVAFIRKYKDPNEIKWRYGHESVSLKEKKGAKITKKRNLVDVRNNEEKQIRARKCICKMCFLKLLNGMWNMHRYMNWYEHTAVKFLHLTISFSLLLLRFLLLLILCISYIFISFSFFLHIFCIKFHFVRHFNFIALHFLLQ